MLRLILSILVTFIVLTGGCEYFHKQPKVPTFTTSYGEIEKGASEIEVVAVLGTPLRIFSEGEGENWYYILGEDEKLLVYFINGKVADVKKKEGSGI